MFVEQLRAAAERDGAGRTDGELLTSFLTHRDADALAALMARHAPMVWCVCRRLLRNPHDAEDAFQATFLVLVRKAPTVMPREMVANWLYGVAHQTAVRQRAAVAKRGVREVQMKEMPEPVVPEDRDNCLLSLLDQELSRLPEQFRVLIVLCDLEGMTRKKVARRFGCPEGTVASRLVRARELLAKRLVRRGLAVSGGALAVALSHPAASAGVPTTAVLSTIQVATLLAAGKAVGEMSGPVAALTEGVLKAMFLKKFMTTAVVLALCTAALTIGSLAKGRPEGPGKPMGKQPAVEKKPVEGRKPMEKQKEAFTAWGKEIGGLQAGLGFRPGERRAYRHGETVTLVVRVRNVGRETVKFEYLKEFFIENPPLVTDADGKEGRPDHILVTRLKHVPVEVSLEPGKEFELGSEQYQLMATNERVKGHSGRFLPLWTGTGKVSVRYDCLFGNTSAGRIKVDPDLLKLATGKLELEIESAATEKK